MNKRSSSVLGLGLTLCFWACASEQAYPTSDAGDGGGRPSGGRGSSTARGGASAGRGAYTGGSGGTSYPQPAVGAGGTVGGDAAGGRAGDSAGAAQGGAADGAGSAGEAGYAGTGTGSGGQAGQGSSSDEGCLQDSEIHVTNNGTIAYTLRIEDATMGEDNPTLRLCRGNTYVFQLNVTGHPFYIKTARTLGDADAYTVFNNGAQVGEVTIGVMATAPDRLYYQCANHAAMGGTLEIVH